ncbi:MAG: ClbS/DfsB family four-helix bundle protein, partial [bacterium]
MTIEKQINRLNINVVDFVRCVTSLSHDLFLKKLDGWSPRDIVAHLIGWNRYMIEGSKQIKKGELPFYDIDPGENYSKINAVLVREYSSMDKQELLNELQNSAQELKQFLLSLNPEEWQHDYGVRHWSCSITIQ